LAAIDLKMRITLEDYDSHDDILDAGNNRLSAEQRAARRPTQDQFGPSIETASWARDRT